MIKSTKQLSDFIQSPGSMLRCTVLIVSLLLSMALCSTASDAGIRPSALVTDPPEPDPVPQLDSNLKLIPLTDALNDLNTRLLHRLSTNNHENSVYSPIAIAIPLAMVLSGARNRTQRELWQALGLTNVYSTPVELSQAFRSVLYHFYQY